MSHNLVSTADEILVFVELLQDCHFVMFVIIYPQLQSSYQYSSLTPLEMNDQAQIKKTLVYNCYKVGFLW